MVDVLEVLSDTGLGKEMHSVVSQGRVEAIVTSKRKDRRLLIEEAAGLGKHRKRRRRAQLKLERTQQNLDRALDVEREARSRLRPLKRQAEAAELHARLERQTLEARWELARDAVRARRAALADAEQQAAGARAAREEAQGALAEVAKRREEAEEALAQRSEQREALARGVFSARSAGERIGLRLDRVRSTAERRRAAQEPGPSPGGAAGRGAGGRPGCRGLDPRCRPGNADRRLAASTKAQLAHEVEALQAEHVAATASSDPASTRRAAGAARGRCRGRGGARAAFDADREVEARCRRRRSVPNWPRATRWSRTSGRAGGVLAVRMS